MTRRSYVAGAPLRKASWRVPLPRFTCVSCAYGASSRIAPERCPMCGGPGVWYFEKTMKGPSPSGVL
jgi:rubrerythrin